jgi:hypothetical protein
MSKQAIEIAAPEKVVRSVLTNLKNGKIEDAMAGFAEKLTFIDYGLGLEFKDKEHLSEFFRKTRELYPHHFLVPDTALVNEDRVILEWTLQTLVTASFYGGQSRKVPASVKGVSVIHIESGKITDWADYYDGATSRRTALAAHFEEWVEL